jgi:hypothetical protein
LTGLNFTKEHLLQIAKAVGVSETISAVHLSNHDVFDQPLFKEEMATILGLNYAQGSTLREMRKLQASKA